MLESFTSKENFTYTKLSEAEQKQRGILGRLVGPIADTKNPTRNGRGYNSDLWENVTNDPIFQEKIKNRCCFGELGHPADREEVLPEKIAICLAEVPKKGPDGKLYGVFDILPTPNGKILKILCDYGCNIGISSRGSGDIIDDGRGNEIVDPDTYNFECFDAVLIPAVETARMTPVMESFTQSKKQKLRNALAESLKNAKSEDREIMRESLNELNINLNEAKVKSAAEAKKAINKVADELDKDELIEKVELTEEPEIDQSEAIPSPDTNITEAKDDEEDVEVEETEVEETETDDNADEAETEDKETEEEDLEGEITVKDLLDNLKDYDKKSPVVFNPITIEDQEYTISNLVFNDADEEGIVSVDIQIEGATADEAEDIDNAEETFDGETNVDAEVEDEAIDDGTDETLESLKSVIREKDALIKENADLKRAQAANDVEVQKLKEELAKVTDGFARAGELAAQGKKASQEVKTLTEQINEKDAQIKNLEVKIAKQARLTESNDKTLALVASLKEQLRAAQEKAESREKELSLEADKYKNKFNESLNAARAYKQKFTAVLNHYIATKAQALGVRPETITNRLNESYTLNDIDTICEELLDNNIPNIPYSTKSKIKLQESKSNVKNSYNDDDDLTDLYVLAGLKK